MQEPRCFCLACYLHKLRINIYLAMPPPSLIHLNCNVNEVKALYLELVKPVYTDHIMPLRSLEVNTKTQ